MVCIFFFNDTATTEIYTLSLRDALPISTSARLSLSAATATGEASAAGELTTSLLGGGLLGGFHLRRLGDYDSPEGDRKSTRLNSSHANISYAVFCLKKKKQYTTNSPSIT